MNTNTLQREQRLQIAQATLDAVKNGSYIQGSTTYRIPAPRETRLYSPADLAHWAALPRLSRSSSTEDTKLSVLQCTTLECALLLHGNNNNTPTDTTSGNTTPPATSRVGVLNFASATKPGGGFLNGAQAQEESIARSSNIYTSLTDDIGKNFYAIHKKDNRGCYYTHNIIWSAGVTIFRHDNGDWHAPPFEVDVVTSAAVNAGVVISRTGDNSEFEEKRIEGVMRERMARILYVFESQGVEKLVLGSFGTGVFRNKVEMVARLWAELLRKDGARFKDSFEQVVFGIIDEKTKTLFEEVFFNASFEED
ncbi:hypothetical protein M422DRAFT_158263 [Sphaerobolus stellatus SS14]|nr:hypothetical protein M422DRAFT_158263 [Sphaerobolus stellatus SS14]